MQNLAVERLGDSTDCFRRDALAEPRDAGSDAAYAEYFRRLPDRVIARARPAQAARRHHRFNRDRLQFAVQQRSLVQIHRAHTDALAVQRGERGCLVRLARKPGDHRRQVANVTAAARALEAVLAVDDEQAVITARNRQRLAQPPVPAIGNALDQHLALPRCGRALIGSINTHGFDRYPLNGRRGADRGRMRRRSWR